jgi:hypothetical protein
MVILRYGFLAKSFWIIGSPFAWYGMYKHYISNPGIFTFIYSFLVLFFTIYFVIYSIRYKCVISDELIKEDIVFEVLDKKFTLMEQSCKATDVIGVEEWGRIIWRPMKPVDIVCEDGTRISIQKLYTNYDEALQFVREELLGGQKDVKTTQ